VKIKKMGLTALLFISANIAFADDLTTHNCTDYPSTAVINSGGCSGDLPGGIGVTPAHKSHSVPEAIVKYICKYGDPDNCIADVYLSDDCTGPIIGTVIFSTTTGIKSVDMKDANYQILGSSFDITIKNTTGGACPALRKEGQKNKTT